MIKVIDKDFDKAIALMEDALFKLEHNIGSNNESPYAKIYRARLNNPSFNLQLAIMICGDNHPTPFPYRSSYYLTNFFKDLGINVQHDGTTRRFWVKDVLENLSIEKVRMIIEDGLFKIQYFINDDRENYAQKYEQAKSEFAKFIDISLKCEEKTSLDNLLTPSIPIPNAGSDKKVKEVFISYRWDNEEHNLKVLKFVGYLRQQGYEAEIDQMISQNETSTDFYKMMHKAITDYKKIIIVLSNGYKERADNFVGGVGTEYNLIIKDIDSNPKKYILVSFSGINDDITPLNFKGREVIDLSDKRKYDTLHAKLQDVAEIIFPPVGPSKPQITPQIITPIIPQKD